MNLGRKGETGLGHLGGVGIVLVFTVITIALGAYIVQNVNTNLLSGLNATVETTDDILANGSLGLANMSGWVPVISIVLAAGAVIGILVAAFRPSDNGV